MLKRALEEIGRIGRSGPERDTLTTDQAAKLSDLETNGYTIIDKFVGTERIANLQEVYRNRLEQDMDIELPCLAQSRIDPDAHAELIQKNFLASRAQLDKMGIAFDRKDIQSYEQVLTEFEPSTLTMTLPDMADFFDLWLDEDIVAISQAYMGFAPLLTEAYIRRNFPAKFKVMNHNWHRDRNHPRFLLKAFIFLSDCTLRTGPHHYISGSIQDRTLDGKPYFTDAEIEAAYPADTGRHIKSVVPAGTIVLEDTRGLHKAGVPEEGYRDLGFAVFTPPIALRPPAVLYQISESVWSCLDSEQRKFIPKGNRRTDH